jgi:hypothetical protein
MPTRPARRLLAALAAACVSSLGLAAPAHAALPAPEVQLADRIVAPGSPAGVTLKFVLDPAAGSYVRYLNATVTVELSGPAGVSLVEDDASCTRTSATKVTCVRARFGITAGTPYQPRFAIEVKAGASAEAGATGTLKATFKADDVSAVTGTAEVEVAEAVALAGGARQQLKLKLGAAFTGRLQVTNRSGSTVRGVVLTADEPNWSFESTEQYSNCRYTDRSISENSLLSCRFDTDIAPGATVGVVLPLRLRKDAPAPDFQEGLFHWWTVDSYEQAAADLGFGGGEPGTGPALQLTPVTTTRAARAQAGEARQLLRVEVLGTSKTDIAVSGATVSGAAGSVVTATLSMRNNGPASRWSATGSAAQARVVLPPGTSYAAENGPAPCYAIDFSPLEEVTNWGCGVMFSFEAGQEVSFSFPLRIDTVIPNATGTIVLEKEHADKVNTCNNAAKIIINPTGGASPACAPSATPTGGTGGGNGQDEPGLPITGPDAALLAGSGVLIGLLGLGVFVSARRRRPGFES